MFAQWVNQNAVYVSSITADEHVPKKTFVIVFSCIDLRRVLYRF